MKIRRIKQEDNTGCGLACIAMLAGTGYEEIREKAEDVAGPEFDHGCFPPPFSIIPLLNHGDTRLVRSAGKVRRYSLASLWRQYTDPCDERPWKPALDEKFRLLAFLSFLPVSCLHGIPVDFIQPCQIRTDLRNCGRRRCASGPSSPRTRSPVSERRGAGRVRSWLSRGCRVPSVGGRIVAGAGRRDSHRVTGAKARTAPGLRQCTTVTGQRPRGALGVGAPNARQPTAKAPAAPDGRRSGDAPRLGRPQAARAGAV